MTALLEVVGLHTWFGGAEAVRGVSFSIAEREVLGLIGESGSGKTVTGLSVLRLLPAHARIEAERVVFRGEDIRDLPAERLRALRGVQMAMIFQDPAGSFNLAKTIGWHLHRALARSGRDEARAALLAEVGIATADRVLAAYPHQLSGGMLQRALIAMVIAVHPLLIIADEPTTNLDNLVERQILDLIRLHQRRLGVAVLFVTHDLVIAGEICDRRRAAATGGDRAGDQHAAGNRDRRRGGLQARRLSAGAGAEPAQSA